MADDLANFIESQKRKLEQERAELLRGANGEVVSTTNRGITIKQDQSKASPRGYNQDFRQSINRGPTVASEKKQKPPAEEESSSIGGLNLGGYEKVQQRLRQERQDEYRKYLSEKNFRSTGKVDVALTDGDGPLYPTKESQQAQPRSDKRGDDDEVYKETLRHRRRGKENYNDSPRDNDYSHRRGNRKPENVFESYEDLLQRKRAQERIYRGFDGPDSGLVRPMGLNAPQYRYNSRSDGYLSQHFNDDEEEEWRYRRNQPRGQRERSFESKRVRFQGEENILQDDMWVKPRRRLDYYDNDDEDEEELLEWLRKRGRRSQRRNSAHEQERQTSKEESLQRSNTDSEIRSQSAPLEGAGVIGGHQESRSDKLKRQEEYKKELQSQMQEQAEIKKREKMQRLGVQQDGTTSQNNQLDKTPPSVNRGSYTQQTENYGIPLANHGPSSRPPPHPAVYPNPYDDPYYYYGTLEMGAPQAPSMGAPLAAPMNIPRVTAVGPRADTQMSGGFNTPGPAAVLQQSGGDTSPRVGLQPPVGYSSFGVLGSDQGLASDKKRAAQQVYQEELKKQIQERSLKKQKEKEEKERYERKIEQEIANYNPWGRGGGGAPLRDSGGQLIANLRTLKQYNDEGIKVSPRDLPPPAETQFEVTLQSDLSPLQRLDGQDTSVQELSGNVGRPSFGRSDPLKEPQPQEDQKKAARQEYQAYLRKQVEEKEKKKREELKREKEEEELLEKKILEDRIKLQKDFEEEQEKSRRKEEQARLKNEEIRAAQETKKREAEKKRKEMEEQRQAELKRKLDEELAAKKASAVEMNQGRTPLEFRSLSPPIPTIAKQQNLQQRHVTPPETTTAVASPPHQQPEPSSSTVADQDVLSQLTALRQQLKNEEKRVQQQIHHTTAVTKSSNVHHHAPDDHGSRRGRRDVDVFQRVFATKNAAGKADSEGYSAAQEFNRIKNEETSSLAEEFRSKFPDPVATNSVLDLQQQAFLMEQEDKLAALRSDINRQNKHLMKGEQRYLHSRRPVSRDSLLESESQFLAIDDPKDVLPVDQLQSRPRQSSARERRRWKQLEEMARNPKAYDTYKPPTPGGFSLNSVTSFNVDEVAAKNEERLRRLEMIQQGGGHQGRGSMQGDPDQVLQRFIDEHRRPPLPSRLSDYPLEAETSYEPI